VNRTAIVILNWNGLGFLKKFLEPVVKYSLSPFTSVWLADNGSDDGSLEWVEASFPEVKIIRFDKNHGYAGGYNLALGNIEAEYYVLLNSDIEVTPGWLSPLVEFMNNNPDVAALQPKILSWQNRKYFEYAGATGGYIDKFGFTFCRGRIFDNIEKDEGGYDYPVEVFWTSGACMMIRATAWRECNGFDTDFYAHMEEIDLCWRLHNKGWRLFAVPQSVVYHVGGGTLPYNSPFKTYLNFRNNLYLLYKNLPEEKFRITLFSRKIMDAMAAFFFLLKGKPQNIAAIIKAHRDYYKNISSLKQKRKFNISDTGNNRKINTILNRSLVFEFYLKGNKTFDKIKKYFNQK